MVRFFIILLFSIKLLADTPPPPLLQKSCLNCHIQEKIPSELIYRRYLMRYSSDKKITKVLFDYLKDPKKENSIMPKQFFLKFPEKAFMEMNQTTLSRNIQLYLDYFDIKKRLILQEK